MTRTIDAPIDAAPAQRSRAHVDGASLVRLRALMAAGVALSVAAAAAQVMAMPSVIRTTVTLVFAVIGPGAAVIAVLLLCGAAVRDRRVIVCRLSPVVMGALVLPLSVTVLVVTAQTMLWLQVWRPAAAIAVLGIASAALLLAAGVALVRPGGAAAEADDDGATTRPAS